MVLGKKVGDDHYENEPDHPNAVLKPPILRKVQSPSNRNTWGYSRRPGDC